MGRVVVVGALLAAVMVATGGPVAADPAGPTHYRATVVAVADADGQRVPVDVEVVGGDAFLVVRAAPGSLVEVPGYDGEPYVRIEPDGVVHVNQLAPARWLNDARYGGAEVEVPAHADADAPPQWTLAARGGEYSWHDHRIHFMSPSLPPQVDPSVREVQRIWDWSLPLVVDGRDVTVQGELVWVPGPTPLVPVGLVVVLAALAVAAAWRWPGTAGWMALAGTAVTAAVGAAKLTVVPAGAEGEPALVVLPAVTLALLTVGLVAGRRGIGRAGLLVAAAGIPLLIWGVLQAGALSRPIVPGPVPAVWVRVAVAVAVAVGLASLTAAVRALLAGPGVAAPAPEPVHDA